MLDHVVSGSIRRFQEACGAQIGAGTRISPKAIFRNHRGIRIGRGCAVGRFVELDPQAGLISLGDNCSLHNYVSLFGEGGITIGSDCRIATGALLISSNHRFERTDIPIRLQPLSTRGIMLGDDVWVGARAIVLDGVRIADGAVVGAGSVVTRDVGPMQIVAGNPARVISERGKVDE